MTNGKRPANPVGWFEIYVEKQSIGEMGFIAIVGDSEGNSIGLHSWV